MSTTTPEINLPEAPPNVLAWALKLADNLPEGFTARERDIYELGLVEAANRLAIYPVLGMEDIIDYVNYGKSNPGRALQLIRERANAFLEGNQPPVLDTNLRQRVVTILIEEIKYVAHAGGLITFDAADRIVELFTGAPALFKTPNDGKNA